MALNMGWIDRAVRFLLASFLFWFGLMSNHGLDGNLLGISYALASLPPFYTAFSGSCFILSFIKCHTLSPSELDKFGDPYN